ncbi:uncharacterized protein LOC128307067 [Anopheles moucheti]|uniref:uncharacterized protein LOC128307067 n=1 Tax=Anopheles moucheti TaxID=186751 RepID=UPI0022F0894C|nr:uncharacterized protein LOC128307067 [Anopheles moucheti]
MTGIFEHLTPGLETGPPEKPPPYTHAIDVPVLGSAEPTGTPDRTNCLRAAYTDLRNMNRGAIRNRLRLVQLLLTIGALSFTRPQYNDVFQWTTLIVLCHSFVISFVLFWDRRCSGTIVRSQLPLLNWRRLELQYTAGVTLVLYVLSYTLIFADKGYRGTAAFNWISTVMSMLTALVYGGETWLQLRDIYDGRSNPQ